MTAPQPADLLIAYGTCARTWVIDKPCPRIEWWDYTPSDRPCRVAELDHYEQPTGLLFCYTHCCVVGTCP